MPVTPNPNQKATLPFAGTVTDSLELMRKVWGLAGLPAMPSPQSVAQFAQALPQTLPNMLSPTLDVSELDKRIADLRAVEQWLNLNTSMLRTTIQSLEVQRNTIATLKSFGGTMLAAMPGPARAAAAGPTSSATPSPAPAAPIVPPARSATRRASKGASPKGAVPLAAMPFSPIAWWGALQDQFARVAAAAADSDGAGGKRSARKPSPAVAPLGTRSARARKRKPRA